MPERFADEAMLHFLDHYNLRYTTRCIRRVLVSVVVAYTPEIHIPLLDEILSVSFRSLRKPSIKGSESCRVHAIFTKGKGNKCIDNPNNRERSKGNHDSSTNIDERWKESENPDGTDARTCPSSDLRDEGAGMRVESTKRRRPCDEENEETIGMDQKPD